MPKRTISKWINFEIRTEMEERFADVTKHVPWFAGHPFLASLVEWFCGISQVRRFFHEASRDENPFAGVACRAEMGIELKGLKEEVPSEGPVVIAANHSHGGPDALALAATLLELRPDTMILCNAELMALPGVKRYFLPVTLMKEGSAGENSGSLRLMLKHVKGGGALMVFPAGRVAFWQEGGIKDPPWNNHVVKLVSRMNATVVPLWFFGGVPPWMQILSKLSGFVRTALIPRGLISMRGRVMEGRVGKAFPSERLKIEEIGWLRKHLESLRDLGN